jgi:septum formation topological specificity factor MinE
MALLSFLFASKPKSANAAKERLQIIIARERNGRAGPDTPRLIRMTSKFRWIAKVILRC